MSRASSLQKKSVRNVNSSQCTPPSIRSMHFCRPDLSPTPCMLHRMATTTPLGGCAVLAAEEFAAAAVAVDATVDAPCCCCCCCCCFLIGLGRMRRTLLAPTAPPVCRTARSWSRAKACVLHSGRTCGSVEIEEGDTIDEVGDQTVRGNINPLGGIMTACLTF